MRKFIAAFQMSLDGYMQGAADEVDWVGSWNDALDLIPDADAAVLGGGMFPGYAHLWGAVAADPRSGIAMLGRELTEGEVRYARWTQRTPHYVLSTTLDKVSLDTASLVRSVGELRSLRDQPGGSVYVIGGAALIASLLNEGLIDELRVIAHPVVLGGGKAPFAKISRSVTLVRCDEGRSGTVVLTYRV